MHLSSWPPPPAGLQLASQLHSSLKKWRGMRRGGGWAVDVHDQTHKIGLNEPSGAVRRRNHPLPCQLLPELGVQSAVSLLLGSPPASLPPAMETGDSPADGTAPLGVHAAAAAAAAASKAATSRSNCAASARVVSGVHKVGSRTRPQPLPPRRAARPALQCTELRTSLASAHSAYLCAARGRTLTAWLPSSLQCRLPLRAPGNAPS